MSCTKKQVAEFTFRRWKEFDTAFDNSPGTVGCRNVSRIAAYADVLVKITGVDNPKDWQSFIDEM